VSGILPSSLSILCDSLWFLDNINYATTKQGSENNSETDLIKKNSLATMEKPITLYTWNMAAPRRDNLKV
jgi:hypothetical protein